MFCVMHPNYEAIGKGPTIDAAIENWSEETHVDVEYEIFREFTFVVAAVESGRYHTANEVADFALRKFKDRFPPVFTPIQDKQPD